MAPIKMEDDPRFRDLLERTDVEIKKVAEACKILAPLAVTFEQPEPTTKDKIPTPEVILDWFAGDRLRSQHFMSRIVYPDRNHPRQARRFRKAYTQRERAYYLFYLARGPIDRAAGQFGSDWIEAVRCLLLYHGGLHVFLCDTCREQHAYTLAQRIWEHETFEERTGWSLGSGPALS